jgi:microcystin-dependent protein
MAGMIMMWGGLSDQVPDGWLICDGSTVSQTQYPDLYTAVQDNFGKNPPDGEFYLPDLRGRFVRGVDDGADRDPDINSRTDMQDPSAFSTTVGSVQSHAFQNHDHGYYEVEGQSNIPDNGGIDNGHDLINTSSSTDQADSSVYSVSSETRPINAYLYFIIQY